MPVTNVVCTDQTAQTNTGFKCKKPDGNVECIKWRFFYPDCPRLNLLCNPLSGAWVPAVTVCDQRLF